MTEEDNGGSGRKVGIAKTLESLGWALFFIWVGMALLLDVGWGVGLLGVGVITLLGQAARKYFGLQLEGFWALVGLFFIMGGVWELFEIAVPLLPLLLIGAGVAVFIGTFCGKHLARRSNS
ncbi:MAG: hypothetical protein OEM62_07610 [Acidobacteriota bacterium]|nr:hypothetical protein [Acidobacteriota bacterium]